MTKRTNGSGSIYQRADGLWQVRATDPATGRRVSKYAPSEQQARRELRAMLSRTDAGEPALDVAASLRSYAAAWLADRAGRRRSPATVREYRRRLEQYVLPRVGGIKVSALTIVDVEDMLDELAAQGLSAASIKGARNALAAMLSDARKARQLAANVATAAQLPESITEAAPRIVPTPQQVVALIDATAGTDLGVLVTLLSGTGARVGEALAAAWADLELEGATWRIARTATRDLRGAAVLGARTKTGDTRTVALPADAVAALREQRARIAEARLAAGTAWQDLDLVFPTSVGTVRDSHNVRKQLRQVAPTFPGSFHGLRHAFATAAVSVLPSDAAVAKVLGHRRKATTVDLYSHLRGDDSRTVANAVSNQLAAARMP